MKLIRAGPHRDVNQSAAHGAILGGVVTGLDGSFLYGVHAGAGARLDGVDLVGAVHPVDLGALRAVGCAVHADPGSKSRAWRVGAGDQHHLRLIEAHALAGGIRAADAKQAEIDKMLGLDVVAQFAALGFEQRDLCVDGN